MKDGVPEQKTRSQDAAISKPAKPKQTKKPKKTPKIRSKIKPDIVTVGTKGISFPM